MAGISPKSPTASERVFADETRNSRRQRTPAVASRVLNASPNERQAQQNVRQQLSFTDDAEEEFQDVNANPDGVRSSVSPFGQTATQPKAPREDSESPSPFRGDMADQTMILERLTKIRQHKRQVLDMIDKLKRDCGDAEIDKVMLRKLIDSYDSFKEQEEQYLLILQKILMLKSQYADSFEAAAAADEAVARLSPPKEERRNDSANGWQPIQNAEDINAADGADPDDEVKMLLAQRNMLMQMLRQQEELRALQGCHTAQQSHRNEMQITSLANDVGRTQQQVSDQQNALASKRRELEDLKRKLDLVRTLCDETINDETQTRVENVVQAPSDTRLLGLEDKLRLLRDRKQRMDQIIDELNTLQESDFGSGQDVNHSRGATREPSHSRSVSQPKSERHEVKLPANLRLAQLQSDSDMEGAGASAMPGLARFLNELDVESDADGGNDMAALSVHMKSAYMNKLNEQRDAVDKLQQEHARLTAIKNQLLNLNPLTDPLAAERALQEASAITNGQAQPEPPSDLWSARRQQAASDHMLNNVRDNVSEFAGPSRRSGRSNIKVSESVPSALSATETGGEEDERERPSQTRRAGGKESPIVNNPRLASFRRNNELSEMHRQNPAQQTGVSQSGRGGGHRPSNANLQHSGHRQRAAQRGSASIEQQYQQLQQHIDSIRSIFQDLMSEHGEHCELPQQQPPLLDAQQQPPPTTTAMTAAAGQPWEAYPPQMNPAALAMQQHQLVLSLLACQQQLQVQQMEMRYLQQLCQDLWQHSSNSYANDDGRARSQSISSIQQPVMPPSFPNMPIPPLDGRPLSSASLYNLLAPNPYLTMPYYPPQLAQQQQQFVRSLGAQPGPWRNNNSASLNNSYVCSNSRASPKTNRGNPLAQMSSSMCQSNQRLPGERMIVSDSELTFGQMKAAGSIDQSSSKPSAYSSAVGSNLNLDALYKSNMGKACKNSNVNGAITEISSRTSSRSETVHPSFSTENAQLLSEQFDKAREIIYSEVATLISQNEQRPAFLVELFRELQLLSSDYLRARALDAIRDVLTRYLTDEIDAHDTDLEVEEHNRLSDLVSLDAAEQTGVVLESERLVGREFVNRNLRDTSEVGMINGSMTSITPTPNGSVSDAPMYFEKPRSKRFENLEDIKDVKTLPLNNATSGAKNATPSASGISRIQNDSSSSINRSIVGATEASKVDMDGLEQQIQLIVDDLIPFLRGNVGADCSPQMLQYMRKLILELTTKTVPAEATSTFFRLQLSSILGDTLAKFNGQKLKDCGEELLADVSEVIFNELGFFRLMQSVGGSVGARQPSQQPTDDLTTAFEQQANQEHESLQTNGNISAGAEGETNGHAGVSYHSSTDEELSPTSILDRLSDKSDDLSAVTAISVSRHAVKLTTKPEFSNAKNDRQSENQVMNKVSMTIAAPVKVQVTNATDDEPISTSTSSEASESLTSSSSDSRSMHTAGADGPFVNDQNEFNEAAKSESRETTPPEEPFDGDEVPEQLELEIPTVDATDVKLDLNFEPHPEDQVQLTGQRENEAPLAQNGSVEQQMSDTENEVQGVRYLVVNSDMDAVVGVTTAAVAAEN